MQDITIRPYSMLVYGLQDDFISILKPREQGSKGQITEPVVLLKNDGTQELNFSIPMHYRLPDGTKVINPYWAITRDNVLVENLRKIKVIFHEDQDLINRVGFGNTDGAEIVGDREPDNYSQFDKVFEFVITEKEDKHSKGELICTIKAEGLAFRELGGTGYRLSLTLDDYLAEYEKWIEDGQEDPEPVMNLNYWCDKIFSGTNWSYEVRMDWSAFDGIIDNSLRTSSDRQVNKIYEDDYVADWEVVDGKLVPARSEAYREKYRAIDCSKSSRYNATQAVAEAFGVYCYYEYEYDASYRIIGRKCVFYNNFIKDKDHILDITYPYNTDEVTRKIESADVVTKMYVTPIDDASIASGQINIASVTANKSREDYILNFDYLYKIGSISKEQYDYIARHEALLHEYNSQLTPLGEIIADLNNQIIEQQAIIQNSKDSIIADDERIKEANRGIDALFGETSILDNYDRPYQAIAIDKGEGLVGATLPDVGIYGNTISLYRTYRSGVLSDEVTDFTVITNEAGNVTGFTLMGESGSYYATYQYTPTLKYSRIIVLYTARKAKDTAALEGAEIKLSELESQLEIRLQDQETLINGKTNEIEYFERMMGPAIKEGNWQDDSYQDYGTKRSAIFTVSDDTHVVDENCTWIFDSDLFEGEDTNYYEESVLQTQIYYPIILLDNLLSNQDIIKNLDSLSLIYESPTLGRPPEYLTIGAGMRYGYLRNNGAVHPAIIITDINYQSNYGGYLGTVSIIPSDDGYSVETVYNHIADCTVQPSSSAALFTMVYPRLEINSLELKTSEDEFNLSWADTGTLLLKFIDYSILIKNNKTYVTIKPQILLPVEEASFKINYALSNASLNMYLDALKVSEENAYPKVSYEVSTGLLPKESHRTLYSYLNSLVHINDTDLLLEQVTGYISEVELHLNEPWEDKITTKDYKTKFEDLFSKIAATTADMQTNGMSYRQAAAAFSSSAGVALLNKETFQTALNNFDFNYAFNNGNLTIDETNGIWATSDSGVVAIRGGGIFCATEKDIAGNWNWNTGITPEGINANLITTGQLDTSLIRIYSGNNVAFQMNGDGLFAYKPQEEMDTGTYVVHNGDGLFFHEDDIDKVEISWNGLKLRNNSGDDTFYLDNNGNLIVNHAHIFDAQIDGLTVGEITQGKRGVNINALSGDTYKYPANATAPTNPELLYEMVFNFVTQQSLSAYYRYDIDDDWTQIDLTSTLSPISYNSSLNTLTVRNTIIPSTYGICFIRIISHCTITSTLETADYENILTVYNDKDGAGGGTNTNTVIITSSNGSFFRNNTGSTTLAVKVFSSEGVDITDTIAADNFEWTKTLNNGVIDDTFTHTGKTLYVTAQNVDQQATYSCKVTY